jgi:hypothetical protein
VCTISSRTYRVDLLGIFYANHNQDLLEIIGDQTIAAELREQPQRQGNQAASSHTRRLEQLDPSALTGFILNCQGCSDLRKFEMWELIGHVPFSMVLDQNR